MVFVSFVHLHAPHVPLLGLPVLGVLQDIICMGLHAFRHVQAILTLILLLTNVSLVILDVKLVQELTLVLHVLLLILLLRMVCVLVHVLMGITNLEPSACLVVVTVKLAVHQLVIVPHAIQEELTLFYLQATLV